MCVCIVCVCVCVCVCTVCVCIYIHTHVYPLWGRRLCARGNLAALCVWGPKSGDRQARGRCCVCVCACVYIRIYIVYIRICIIVCVFIYVFILRIFKKCRQASSRALLCVCVFIYVFIYQHIVFGSRECFGLGSDGWRICVSLSLSRSPSLSEVLLGLFCRITRSLLWYY